MTKDAELAVLKDAIKKLGQDSYCGPWLQSVLGEVECDMRNDLPVSPTLNETQLKCKLAVEEATAQALRMRTEAERDAANITNAARDNARSFRFQARHQLLAAADKLN